MSANLSDRDLLAWTIIGEAGRESRAGQDAVAHNILNRAYSGRFPNSVSGVIMQPGQYSMWNDVTGYAGGSGGNSSFIMQRTSPADFARAQGVADDALSGRSVDPTGGSLNYYNPNVASPSWGVGSARWTPTADIGNHTFGVAGGSPYAGDNPNDPRYNSYRPAYDNFSPSGYDYAGDAAPGSFSDTLPKNTNVGYEQFSGMDVSMTDQQGSFNYNEGTGPRYYQPGIDMMTGKPWSFDKDQTETAPPDPNAAPSQTLEDAAYIKGDQVSDPKAASQGQGTDVPTAIVTAANQEAKTAAAAAKTTAEATLKATQTQTASDAKLQSERQSWASNWAVRLFLFIVGAIFLAGGLFLFGGQAIFQPAAKRA